MSLDERVRSSLDTAAERVAAPRDVEAALADVLRRSAVRRRKHRAAAALAVALIVGVSGAVVVTRPSHHASTAVATGPSSTVSTTTMPSGALAFCPAEYRFDYLPDGWTKSAPGVISGPTGSAKLTAVATSSATTVVTKTYLAGLPATERTNDAGVFETRLDAGTDPSCGGELAVVGLGGVSEVQFTLIVNSVTPAYSLVDRQRFQGIWPSSDLDVAISSTELTDPTHAAIGFLVDQLGWHGGSVIDDRPAPYYDAGSHLLTVRGEPGQPLVKIVTIRLPGTGYWAVASADNDQVDQNETGSASITESTATPDEVRSSFADAASAELTLYYGTQGVDLTTTAMPPDWTFELGGRPDIPGALIIRWRDAGGAVIKVHAVSFPPGDFAAG